MERQRMYSMLKRCEGIGVEATHKDGHTMYYFYEDFNESGEGINRAIKQLYPKKEKGIYTKLVFISLDELKASIKAQQDFLSLTDAEVSKRFGGLSDAEITAKRADRQNVLDGLMKKWRSL